MRRLVVMGALVLSAAWLILTAGPAWGQGSGTVTATVVVQAAACITITPNSFTYAPATFSSTGSLVVTLPNSTKPVVQSCSSGSQNYSARGGTTTSGATWSLVGSLTCPDPNKYIHELGLSAGGFVALTTTDAAWESGVTAGSNKTVDTKLTMPCTGSTGLSQTVTIPIVITAIVQ